MLALSDRLFQEFSQFVHQHSGIYLHEGKKELLQARLNKRLRATGLKSYGDYYIYITSSGNHEEIVNFLDCVSTNFTYFFREPKQFEFLEKVVYQELKKSQTKSNDRRIRIWCAACSTGEESYSIAMSIHSCLHNADIYDIKILATDISTKALSIASAGIYSTDKINKLNKSILHNYFTKIKNDDNTISYDVIPIIKNMITFRRLNLKDDYPFKGPFDFIFCRNVMIYFDKATQQDLVQKISGYLSDGGYLFVGHSESLTSFKHLLTYVQPSIYRK